MSLTIEEQALESQWTSLSKDVSSHLVDLNNSLKSKTYIVGNKPTDADKTVFNAVFPLASKWSSVEDLAKYRHIIRWIDLIQNTIVDPTTKLSINFDTELPREIKEKKKKESASPVSTDKSAKKEDSTSTAQAPAKGGKPDPEAMAKAKAAKEAKKAAKAKAKAETEANAKAEQVPPNPSMIDLRVGFIEKAIKHPNADALYVSTIQMGDEEGPRTVCSGLVKHFPLEAMQQRYVIVIANLKPVTMRGVKSSAMVLCAANPEGKIEFVNPPAGSQAGDKIFFEGYDGTPEKVLNPKKKIWETVQPHFTTTENLEVVYREEGKPDAKLVNKKGELCKNNSIVGAEVR